tara:strand:+ start:6336 stop:8192 length:1857 start_codon:yes stop_codon:yes gene_type:complete
VKVENLKAMSHIVLDVARSEVQDTPPRLDWLPFANNPQKHFAPRINGLPMSLNGGLELDGPAIKAKFRARVSTLVWADLWITYVPSEPWFRWEMVLNAASPQYGHIITEMIESGFEVEIGDAVVMKYGGEFGKMMAGQSIAQGQARTFAGIGGWLTEMDAEADDQFVGMLTGSPVAVDDRWKDIIGGMGVPLPQDQFSAADFVVRNTTKAYGAMGNWGPVAGLGVTPASGVTGSQEEQCFGSNGTECFAGGKVGPQAAFIRYLTAMTYSRRPCNWRENNGDLLRFDDHPNLIIWSGPPHWHPNVGSDKLGLTRNPTPQECNGWFGPDREHWFYGSLWTAALLFQSDALQWQLEQGARQVWFQETVQPGLSTSGVDAARSVGWFGILATAICAASGSHDVRSRVKQRAQQRLNMVYLPNLDKPELQHVIWDKRKDARLSATFYHEFTEVVLTGGEIIPGPVTQLPPMAESWETTYRYPWCWMPYQQAIGAYGLYLLGHLVGSERAITAALHAAKTVVDHAYVEDIQGQHSLQTWSILPLVDGSEPLASALLRENLHPGTVPVSWFRHAWLPLALWVRLQSNEPDALAEQWWSVTQSEAAQGDRTQAWFPPRDRVPHRIG